MLGETIEVINLEDQRLPTQFSIWNLEREIASVIGDMMLLFGGDTLRNHIQRIKDEGK